MKLDDAYNAWGQQSDNRELFQKTKTTFRKMWWLIPTNKPCSYYTLTVLGRALAQANGAHGDKVSAASVMCHVLNYAYQCDPEGMDKPRFGFSDIVNYEGTKPSPMVQTIASSVRGQVPDTSVRGQVPDMSDKTEDAADNGDADAGNCDAKGQSPDREPVKVQSPGSERPSPDSERPNDDEPLVKVNPAAKARREAELARRAGTTPKSAIKREKNDAGIGSSEREQARRDNGKSVVQLDVKTLKPIKVWKSCHAPQTELGIRNVQRAVERHGLAGGYYWCRPGDEESFKPADKRSSNGARKKGETKPQPITKEQRELHSKVFDRPTNGDAKHGDAHVRGQVPGSPQTRGNAPARDLSPDISSERPNTDMPTDEQQEQLKQAEVQFQQAVGEHVEGVLQKCSQDELIAELRRRHWRGTLHITQTIEL